MKNKIGFKANQATSGFKGNNSTYDKKYRDDADDWYQNKYGYIKATYETPQEIKDFTQYNIVVFDQKILNGIQKKCTPKAGGSEFQFHYRALQVKVEDEIGRKMVFTFPTVFFNFPQKVSSASVDFHLDEVAAVSEKVKEASKKLANLYSGWFPKEFFTQRGYNIRFVEGEIGSIHRHPGRFGFSLTDLRNNPLNPGVIFRVRQAEDLHQVDSVLYCGTDAELYTTETRLFNTKLVDPNDEDKGADGIVAECPTVTYIRQEEEQIQNVGFGSFFGHEDKPASKYMIHKFETDEVFEEAEKIIELFFQKGYEPIDVVDPEMIENRFVGYYGGHVKKTGNGYWKWDAKQRKSIWVSNDKKSKKDKQKSIYDYEQDYEVGMNDYDYLYGYHDDEYDIEIIQDEEDDDDSTNNLLLKHDKEEAEGFILEEIKLVLNKEKLELGDLKKMIDNRFTELKEIKDFYFHDGLNGLTITVGTEAIVFYAYTCRYDDLAANTIQYKSWDKA